jgi:hypothetical protein
MTTNPLYKQQDNEDDFEYGLRLISTIVETKPNDLSWQDIVDLLDMNCHEDTLRKATNVTKYSGYNVMQYFKEKYANSTTIDSNEYMKELNLKKQEIQRERMKFQTEKLEFNKWQREFARDELFISQIVDAINALTPLPISEIVVPKHSAKEGILVFGDEHFGAEFTLLGLFGEVLNSYDEKIFYERMNDLLNQTIEIVQKENFSKIKVYSMGDFIDGILRVGQLMKLRYGVVDSTIKYVDFLSTWLWKLTQFVTVEFHMVHGNHSELRMLGQPKGSFTDDNMGKIVFEMIKTRLANNPNFIIIKNPTGLIFDTICGYNILGIHGEVKNMENAIKDFSKTYKTEIDFLLAGHLHHSKSETVGINSEVINIPSIIGIDSYSLSLNKTSNAGATFLIFEGGKGKVCEYSIKLN